jgi:hypothetical protein
MIRSSLLAGIVGILAAMPGHTAEPSPAELTQAFSTLGQPAAAPLPTEPARITGFRSARFGMTVNEVRAAVAIDFGKAATALLPEVVEPGFSALATRAPVAEVEGPARLIYVFRDDHLIAVNVVRMTRVRPSDSERRQLITVAERITAQMLSKRWRPFALVRGRPVGGSQLIVFSGADDVGDGVELRLVGVGYAARAGDGQSLVVAQPSGPAALRLVFRMDIDGLAILRPGDF